MVKRNRNNKLAHWEIALVKAMLEEGDFGNDQDILAYFTRPTRSINHRAIAEIRTKTKHSRINAADKDELLRFLARWPQIDWDSGLHIYGDELLVKSREAMLVAVQSYNNPKTYFRSEIFIVTAIISWTYLLHAHYKIKNIDFRYKIPKPDGTLEVMKTKHGADKFWELTQCLNEARCPLEDGVQNNLKFLIELRHEIEHQMTQRIDGKLSAKLQACALNYNTAIKKIFGSQYGLDGELSFAIQFSGIEMDQKKVLMEHDDLPANIETMREIFEDRLTDDQYKDPKYAYRVIFVPKIVNAKSQADSVVEFVPAGSEKADNMNAVYLKEVDRARYRPAAIVSKMKAEGFYKFKMHDHTKLWQALNAKDPNKNYGVSTESDGWRWYERWVEAVRQHCEEQRDKYE